MRASYFVLGSPPQLSGTADASILAVDLLPSTGTCWVKLSRFPSKLVLQTFTWESRGQGPTGDTVTEQDGNVKSRLL